MFAQIAQAVDVLAYRCSDCFVGGGGCELGRHANLHKQRSGQQKRERVEYEGGIYAPGAGDKTTQAAPSASITDQVAELRAFIAPNCRSPASSGKMELRAG